MRLHFDADIYGTFSWLDDLKERQALLFIVISGLLSGGGFGHGRAPAT